MSAAAPPLDPDLAPIFVVGTGRSGTTLLRMMLNAHPRIHVTHEASFYLARLGLGRDATATQWLERYRHTFSFAYLGVTAADVAAELRGPGPEPMAAGFGAVMRAAARRRGKPRHGDKTPNHALHLRRIFEDFPGARVVHVVRDPRGAVASLDRMPWAASSTALNAIYCDQQVRAVRRFAARVHDVRLEDLLASPEAAMRKVLAHVGEPWDDAVLDHQRHAPADDLPPFPWFQDARGNVRAPAGTPSWRRQLSPEWIRIVERTNALAMELYGYEPSRLDPEPSRLACLRARAAELPEVIRFLGRLARFARRGRGRALPDARADAAALLALNPSAWAHYPGFVVPEIPRPVT